jgi:hypothetical protein
MLNLSIPTDRDKLADLILDDINTFCSTFYESGHRNHLGASTLGEECWRKLWYQFRWVKKEQFDGRMLRLFNVGHSAEPRFVSYLRGIGFEVREFENPVLHYHPESGSYFYDKEFNPGDGLVEDVSDYPGHIAEAAKQGVIPKQFKIVGASGHYGGSLDGMCKAPARYEISEDLIFLNEFKTNGTGTGFDKVEKDGIAKAKPRHYAQISQYGYHYKLKYGLYIIENKNDSAITVKIVELDWNLGKQLEQKAESIIFSKESPPRISDNPAFFNCKWCNYAGICHNGEQPEKNCRSCRNAMPTQDATWTCSLHGLIPEDFIKIGCQDWLPI